MDGLRTHLMRHRMLAALLVAAALLLRALVPAGYMVAPAGEAKQIFVTVCSGLDGKVERIALPVSSQHDSSQQDHDGKDSPCAFTALASLAAMPQLADLPPVPAAAPRRADAPPSVAIGRGLAAPPPPQTGPPLTA